MSVNEKNNNSTRRRLPAPKSHVIRPCNSEPPKGGTTYLDVKEHCSTQFMRAVFSAGRSIFAFGENRSSHSLEKSLGTEVVKSSSTEPGRRFNSLCRQN